MKYKIRIYAGHQIKDVQLKNINNVITIGSSNEDTVKIDASDVCAAQLIIQFEENVWCCYDRQLNKKKKIADGDVFMLSMQNRIAAVVYTEETLSQSVKLGSDCVVLIGRNPECTFQLSDRSVGKCHAKICVDDLGVTIYDLNSLNGTFVNNCKVTEKALQSGDVISIGKYNILFHQNTLELCNDASESGREKEKIPYPVFRLSPRLRHQAPSEVIEIKEPPNIGNMPMVNWLSFLPMLATRSVHSLIFPATNVVSTMFRKKKFKEEQKLREDKYIEYLEDVKAQIEKNREDQFLSLAESNPETKECYRIVAGRERTMWERTPEDDDFMKIRVGIGDIETSFRIKFPDNILKLHYDELEGQGTELGKGNQILQNAPILCDLKNDLSVGVVGSREKVIEVVRNMIVQVTTSHSYKDVKLVTLFEKQEAKEWEFVKWLPHSFTEDRTQRYISNSMYSASVLDKLIESERKENKEVFYLFVVTNAEMIYKSEIENSLDHNRVGAGIGVIYAYDHIGELPKSCNVIVDLQNDKNEIYHKSNVGKKQIFTVDEFSDHSAEEFARKMAPVRLAEKKSSANLPSCVTFLEGYGVNRVDELPVWENWQNSRIGASMAVPLGVREDGEKFLFNILPGADFLRYHGPFGLVAGSPGSGKSEMMQSWILSLAAKFSPEDLSFVIVDYKGTGMLLPFKKLPHLAGTISNLDGNVRRNIIALTKEMQRRQEIFDEVGLVPADIKEYHKRGYHKNHKPLPFIILVIDEFAEVKKNLPELVPVVESLFAVGRSLGIYAIVSTQKPSGVVTDKMYGTSQFRWCCRVASIADSKEMIKRADAAKITNAGRACVLIGEDDIYGQVQSYWSGAPYRPNREEKQMSDLPVSVVDITGRRVKYETTQKVSKEQTVKEIDAVVEYIGQVAAEHHMKKAHPIWQDRLKNRIYLEDVKMKKAASDLIVNVGLVDDPYTQSQYPLAINLTEGGHCLVYGAPGTGKTTFLQTFVMSLATTYRADTVHLYGIDFGSWSLKMFSELPHMGGIAIEGEKEKIEKLLAMLKTEIENRRKLFAMEGFSTIKAYNQNASKKLPYMVLVVDNFNSLYTQYMNLGEYFEGLVQQGANYGVYLVASVNKEIYKISGMVKNNNIALQLKDRSEYISIVGKTDGMEPENYCGRGLVKGEFHVHEFQTALPACGADDNIMLGNLKNEVNKLTQMMSREAKMIPVMPEEIRYGEITGEGLVLGLDTEKIEPVSIDLQQESHCILVSEGQGCKGTELSQMLLRQLREKEHARIVTFDHGKGSFDNLQIDEYIKLESAEELDRFVEELAVELNLRKKMESLEECETIVLAIDGYKEMYDAVDDKTAARLSALVRMGKGLKVILLALETAERINILCAVEPIIRTMASEGVGILIGGNFKAHSAFVGNLDYTEANIPLGISEAYKNVCGQTVKFKEMQKR